MDGKDSGIEGEESSEKMKVSDRAQRQEDRQTDR